MLEFLMSFAFLGYVITFYLGLSVGFMVAALLNVARDNASEGVGHGPVCTRNERAALQAGPGGGQ